MPRILRIAPLLFLTALVVACSSKTTPAPYGLPLKVGVVGPMTGPYTTLGGQLRYGVDQAMEDINTHGGVLDHQLRLRAVDDRCDPKRAASIAQGLAEEKVAFVVGHVCAAASEAAAPIYAQNNIIMITPASTDPALTDDAAARGDTNIFRTVPRDDMQGPALASHIIANYQGQQVGFVQDESSSSAALIRAVRAALAKAGISPAAEVKITAGSTDFADEVAQLKASNVGVIVFGGRYQEAAALLLEARREGLHAVMGGGDALATKDFWRIAGPAAEGTFMPLLPDPSSMLTAWDVGTRLARFGVDITGYTLRAYAAVQVFVEAAKQAQSLDAKQVAAELRKGRYHTVIGPLSFDEKGDLRSADYRIYVWHNGRY